ncbi:MAG: DNA-3-methyladenine glycosylase 2 family protein [Acidimicrobiia bacterium]|nr:DNA-3-methyladenine glycosylase 2 family protein [Acidimicrobiia bacterium]
MNTARWTPRTPIDLAASIARFVRYGADLRSAVSNGYLYRTTSDGLPYRIRQTEDGGIEVGTGADRNLEAAVKESRFRLGETLPQAPLEEVAGRVPAVADQLRRMPGYRIPLNPAGLEVLVSSICAQQVNMRWANTTMSRLIRRYGTEVELNGVRWWRFPDAEKLAAADPADIRAMQFTTRKSGYIVGVAGAMVAGDLTGLEEDGNETVIRRLVALRGVGRWTAEWFLARCLARPDVVPAGDLGVRKVVSRYVMGAGKGEVLPEPDVRAAVESWGDGGNWAIHLLLERWAEEHAR